MICIEQRNVAAPVVGDLVDSFIHVSDESFNHVRYGITFGLDLRELEPGQLSICHGK